MSISRDPRVLVVEDDDRVRTLTAASLTELGYGVLAADSAAAATGSAALAITIGIVLVACFAARVAASVPLTMTSTLSCTNSAARPASRSKWPSALRYSNLKLRPST